MSGDIPVRDTLAGWGAWRLTRHDFTPTPRMTLARLRALSPAKKAAHDLARAATHANLPLLGTPMSRQVDRLLLARIRQNVVNARPATRAGVMVSGGGYQGKTETVCEIAATFEDSWRELHRTNPETVPGTRDAWVPVAYVQTPVTAKPKSTCKAIFDFYGAPTKRMDLPELVAQVAASLTDHGTTVLIDDITRLWMHRADDQDTLDLIRAFMSMHVTLVLVGVDIPASGLMGEGRPTATNERRGRSTGGSRPRPNAASTSSNLTGSATTPPSRPPPGLPTSPVSRTTCGYSRPAPGCSPTARCPSTSTPGPTVSSAFWNGSSRTAAPRRSPVAPSA
ncbi:TniB family NTP-binding protein [Streptomyces sp. NPDC059851]|uniref:TniB family NTP-binding protein n=1 Tax=Streptomyces sp. NPDC059851 TaxID=3346971 RepID=UPI0036653B73